MSVAGSLVEIDEALKRYSLAVDEWREMTRSLKDAEEIGNTYHARPKLDRKILCLFFVFLFCRVLYPFFFFLECVQVDKQRGGLIPQPLQKIVI
jgi:hypothetical protein